jgi:phosphoglycolate phosphatase
MESGTWNLELNMLIIWDFNGTLLNDMQICIDCMNIMLKERKLPPVDLKRYREVFTFPVKEYYLALGFDFEKEPFDIPAHQFIDLYRENLHRSPLHEGTENMLGYFKDRNYKQVILSAMEQDFLEETLASKGILGYFDRICGITNHLGEGKLEMARELLATIHGNGEEIWIIGDTVHDYEVAVGSGIPCILIANGHQSYERLETLNCLVIKNINELKSIFN